MSTARIPNPPPAAVNAAPTEAPSGPWWKYGHMWLVVGGPSVVVIAAFVTLWLAIRTPDPVYTDADMVRARASTAAPDAGQGAGAAMAPAMQGRNHAATGGVARPAVGGSAPGQQP